MVSRANHRPDPPGSNLLRLKHLRGPSSPKWPLGRAVEIAAVTSVFPIYIVSSFISITISVTSISVLSADTAIFSAHATSHLNKMTVGPTVEADMEKDINESTMMSISKMKATPLMDGEKEAEHVDMDRTMIKSVHLCQ